MSPAAQPRPSPTQPPAALPLGEGGRRVAALSNDAEGTSKGLSIGRRVLLILVSIGIHGLAFPPVAQPALVFAVVPLLLVALSGLPPRRGAALGLLWGTGAIWSVGWWVPLALSFYYGQPAWFGFLFALWASLVFAGSFAAGFGACFCAFERRLDPRREPVRWSLTVAALWVVWEFLRANLFTGDPWLLLGDALAPWPRLLQAADVGGGAVLSFTIVWLGAAAVVVVRSWRASAGDRGDSLRALRPLIGPLAMVGALLLYGQIQIHRIDAAMSRSDGTPLRLTVIQGNNDVGAEWREELYGAGLETYVRATQAAARRFRPDVVVWPESAVTFFLAHEPAFREVVSAAARASGAEILLGAPHHAEDAGGDFAAGLGDVPYFNSAFAMDSSGEVVGRYDKVHLLPFAEYFPLQTIGFLRRRFERVRFFTPGGEPQLLPLRGGQLRAAVAICFEAIFPAIVAERIARGADLLVNLSNDSWLGPPAGRLQHLSMVVLRAVENRIWVVRGTTTGVSAVIDPAGRVVAATEVGRPEALDVVFDPHATIAAPPAWLRASFPWWCAAWLLWILGRRAARGSEPRGPSHRAVA